MSGPEIVPLTPETEQAYRQFVEALPDALLYYSLPYRDLLVDLLGCSSHYKMALERGQVTGVMPLMVADGPWGKVANSLPFYGSNGGVLATTAAASGALHSDFDDLCGRLDVAAATIICHPLRPTSTPPIVCDFVDERVGQWTKLPEITPRAEDQLMALFDGSARRNVRKAQSERVTIRVDCAAMDFLESTHVQNMAAIGGRAKSHDFFAKVADHFEPEREFKVYVAERAGRLVAALLLFLCGRTVEYFTPVVVEEERVYQPMALIIYTAMLDALSAGYQWWNWGGTWASQEGVYRFKRKWGAQDFPYRYYVRVNRREILSEPPQALLDAYPNFYVVPFGALKASR